MKEKISDYIVNYFIEKEITQVFTVVGGGAMHLNDSFGHNEKVNCVYNHHEQACAMAAEGYARVTNKPAIVCVTSGPGAVNALNGVVGAYQDSIPMIVISGQVKTTLLEKNSGLNLRTLGGQEFDIISAVGKMTKYAETVQDVKNIKSYLDIAYFTAISGRPGPTWLDIPIDVQGSVVETDELIEVDSFAKIDMITQRSSVSQTEIQMVLNRILCSERPIIYAGNGIRLSGAEKVFLKLVKKLQIPVVTCWDSIDLIESDNPFYCGRGGTMGNRAGNFAVQNSDLLICIGNRLSIYQVGYDVKMWARAAYIVDVDVDCEEQKKSTVRIDLPIISDAKVFIESLFEEFMSCKTNLKMSDERIAWNKQCIFWKGSYPVVEEKHWSQEEANVYAFIDALSKCLPNESYTVVSNGSASVVGSSAYYIGKDSRFMMNCAISSMGYGLPASIGVKVALYSQKNDKAVICVEGDGSIMMNLQELATLKANNLPIKIFIINNNGYHQIRLTQNNLFHNGLVGVGPESGDLWFPSFCKIADAFDIAYCKICKNDEIKSVVEDVLNLKGSVLCEVFVDTKQIFEPKSATKKMEDGTLVSSPLEDMAPFLTRKELHENMYIK